MTQVGARTEFQFSARRRVNGTEAAQAMARAGKPLHLSLLNRGVLITPFHNMMLVCPDTCTEDVDRLLQAFDESVEALLPRR